MREVGSKPVQSTKGRPPVQGMKSFSVIWMIPPIVGFGGMKISAEGALTPVVRETGVLKGATGGAGECAVGCAVAKGSGSKLMVDSKLSSKDQVVVRSSSWSSRRDSGDPSRLGLDVGRVGVLSEMVELGGEALQVLGAVRNRVNHRFWAQ